jgi:hypothetical protein
MVPAKSTAKHAANETFDVRVANISTILALVLTSVKVGSADSYKFVLLRKVRKRRPYCSHRDSEPRSFLDDKPMTLTDAHGLYRYAGSIMTGF